MVGPGDVIRQIWKAHAAQSVDLTQWQTSAGLTVGQVGLSGGVTITPSDPAVNALVVNANDDLGVGGYLLALNFALPGAALPAFGAYTFVESATKLMGVMVATSFDTSDPSTLLAIAQLSPGATYSYGDGRHHPLGAGVNGVETWWVSNNGHEVLAALAAPADGDVATSERFQWYDDTIGATAIRFKQRDSAGTLVTGIVASQAFVAAGYQPLDADLTAIAALTTTAYGRSLLEVANASALRTLGGLVIGTDVPAQAAFDDHSARHENGGADAIKLDDLAAPDDNTDLNVSTTKHGLTPKLSNVATEYLSGTGVYSTPAGGGAPTDAQYIVGAANGSLSAEIVASAFALTLIDDADAATARTTLGVLGERIYWVAGAYSIATSGSWTYAAVVSTMGQEFYSAGAQNNSITFDFLRTMPAGTYTLMSGYKKGSSYGIYTYETSPDNAAWTALTTVDGYGAGTSYVQTLTSGLVVAAPFRYLRATAATKNASSSSYYLVFFYHGLVQTA